MNFKDIIEYFSARTFVFVLSLIAVVMASFFVTPYLKGYDLANFVEKNAQVISFLIILLLIPGFMMATRTTLRSDLTDQEIVKDVTNEFRNIENYKKDALLMSVSRLYLETMDQRSSSIKNLSLGFGLTVMAVILAINLSFSVRADLVVSLPLQEYLYKFLLPRVSVIFFIQIIAAFFLGWYAKNMKKIGDISDKITIIELKMAAIALDGDNTLIKQSMVDLSFKDITPSSAPKLSRAESDLLVKLIDKVKL